MTEQETQKPPFPENWLIAQDFNPAAHNSPFKGRDYLSVQNRLVWFLRDQRALIVMGLATMPHIIKTELVELDRAQGWAHFRTYICDVLGNEATMYGSESANDFPDYIEKASTKSLGRALLLLGYGTAFCNEMDEGERVVDAPVQQRRAVPTRPQAQAPRQNVPVAKNVTPITGGDLASERQLMAIRKLSAALGRPEPDLSTLTAPDARAMVTRLQQAYNDARASG